MTQQRLDRIEDEFETVKQLLASAARYAEMAHQDLAELTARQDQTQQQMDRTDIRLQEFIERVDRQSIEHAEQMEQTERRIEQLEAIAVGLDRNFLEFQRTTNAALERMDRILDYLLRQQQGR